MKKKQTINNNHNLNITNKRIHKCYEEVQSIYFNRFHEFLLCYQVCYSEF